MKSTVSVQFVQALPVFVGKRRLAQLAQCRWRHPLI
jgi:hypothetical protein